MKILFGFLDLKVKIFYSELQPYYPGVLGGLESLTRQGHLATDGFATGTRGIRGSAASGSRGSGSHRKLSVDVRLKREVLQLIRMKESAAQVDRVIFFKKREVLSKKSNESNTSDNR